MENNKVYHSGIKGMKWGVRRYQNADGTLTDAGKKRYAKELAKVKAEQKIVKNKLKTQAKFDNLDAMKKDIENQKSELESKKVGKSKPAEPVKKTVRDLSDDELKEKIARLELEKRYKDLTKTETVKGESFVVKTIKKSGENIAPQLGTYLLGATINAMAKKAANGSSNDFIKELLGDGNIVNPKKGQKDK